MDQKELDHCYDFVMKLTIESAKVNRLTIFSFNTDKSHKTSLFRITFLSVHLISLFVGSE